MKVIERNNIFASGNIDREDLWPKITEYEQQARTFRFQFGLDKLPLNPGILLIRGPRQYGKSTWLELTLRDTLENFGKGSAFFLNGDDLATPADLEREILELKPLYNPKAKVRRLFIDEISAVEGWEKALKRLADRGDLKDLLVITTGSKATDIRRGSERLPGRKGKLSRTDYIFTGISYKDFHEQFKEEMGDDCWIAYLLTGGSPIAAKEIWQFGTIPGYFFELIRDWILGEVIKTGRSRQFLVSMMRVLFERGGSKTGYLRLARESGLANNTLASEYVEQLSDLMSVISAFQWDAKKRVPMQRKPCKFHFVNLAVALAFSPCGIRSLHDFKQLPRQQQGVWLEWLIAQEIFRRQCIRGVEIPETINFWGSDKHEIDFVDARGRFIEVKLGRTGPLDFTWFSKAFPKDKLLVISESEFETQKIKGVTIEQFLLADGFPHPYPGQVEDPGLYNDVLKGWQ